jgi:neutral ceramidase
MKCGVSQVCITPPVGVELAGFVARQQPSIGIHDDLYARALYLEEAGERLLWLHADLLAFERDHAGRLRRALAEELGLHERQILFSATHTHSGPGTLLLREAGAVDANYMAQLDQRLRQAAHHALAHPVDVTLRFVEASSHLGVDRRVPGPHAHADPALPVLTFQDSAGNYVAVLANYAMHNVALSADNRYVSADIAGAVAYVTQVNLPGRPVVLFTNGACGNINPPAESVDFAVSRHFGHYLGQAALYAAQTAATAYPGPTLSSALDMVDLPLLIPSADEVETEYERALSNDVSDSPVGEKIGRAYRAWHDETLALLAAGAAPCCVTVPVQVVRIGPVTFVALGGEVFSHMAVVLRAALGPHTYVVGYANGDVGYLPHRAIYAEGGYEVEMAYKFYGHFMVAPGGFEALADRAVALAAACVPAAGEQGPS